MAILSGSQLFANLGSVKACEWMMNGFYLSVQSDFSGSLHLQLAARCLFLEFHWSPGSMKVVNVVHTRKGTHKK